MIGSKKFVQKSGIAVQAEIVLFTASKTTRSYFKNWFLLSLIFSGCGYNVKKIDLNHKYKIESKIIIILNRIVLNHIIRLINNKLNSKHLS